jgi:hypothetical protein
MMPWLPVRPSGGLGDGRAQRGQRQHHKHGLLAGGGAHLQGETRGVLVRICLHVYFTSIQRCIFVVFMRGTWP